MHWGNSLRGGEVRDIINFMQNLGIVLLLKVNWPGIFKDLFKPLEVLCFNFDLFGGMGEEMSIAMGVLIPAWLVFEFDTGLYYERHYYFFFGAPFLGDNHFTDFRFVGFFLSVTTITFFVLAILGIDQDWYGEMTIAFIYVLAGLFTLSVLHQVYIRRLEITSNFAGEDFEKTRQEDQTFFFLFFYTVAYLAGGECF